MLIRQIADEQLAQYAYLVGCQQTGEALLVDPERDIDRYLAIAANDGLTIVAVAETHIHADFLSGAREFSSRFPERRIYLSAEGGDEWQYSWPVQDAANAHLLRDGDTFRIGRIELRAWHTPGHTPEHLSFVVTDRGAGAREPIGILSGDFLFVGDLGRPDLLETAAGVRGSIEPSARLLYRSARSLAGVPDYLQVWPGHGAGSACGKALGAIPMSTVGYEQRSSPALEAAARGERAFVHFIMEGQPEPPHYFARMKLLNRIGPPILAGGPTPRRLTVADVRRAHGEGVQVIDTRPWPAFLRAHLARGFHAPLDRSFPTIVGSMVDPERPAALIVAEAQARVAIRELHRIGYDRVDGWAPPGTLEDRQIADLLATTKSVDISAFEARDRDAMVLDVRSAREYGARHVPGAVNIAHTRLRAELDRLVNRGTVYVHCASGVRAAAAAAFLEHHGVHAIHVDGVFERWAPAPQAASMQGAA